ncbi:hypothetical protein T484DRAFT_1847119 [Baffinella frigidus]|nr:hypothetical protein T484DRAFT_1847119 [Cryptophyta sp. CCMP2293]
MRPMRAIILCAAALLSVTAALHVPAAPHGAILRAAPSFSSSAMHLRGGLTEDSPVVAEDSPIVADDNGDCEACGKNYTLSGNLDTHELCGTCNNFFEHDLPDEATHVHSIGDGGVP